MEDVLIPLDCPSGHDDCTEDCGRCKGRGVIQVPATARTVAKCIAADFRSFEQHEWAVWRDSDHRDEELVQWALRCLANPKNGWSTHALVQIEAARSKGGALS